jgi:hypothetical protein
MRFTKIALLTFGGGILFGLVVVVGEWTALARIASGLMALGIAAIPLSLAADGRLAFKRRRGRPAPRPAKKRPRPAARQSVRTPTRRPARSRRPPVPKR